MIYKSYIIEQNISPVLNHKIFLFYGENEGLKKDFKDIIKNKNPKLNILKGSVAIGGQQTGVYPSNSPGGWYVIGNSPINFFDIMVYEKT